MLARVSADPGAMAASMREALRHTDERLAAAEVRTLEQIKARNSSGTREPAYVVGAFAMVAMLLAALGLYGVLAGVVAQQRREIAIRMALGADGSDVLRLVLSNASAMVGAGLVCGLLAALGLTRVLGSLLFNVTALDPSVLLGAGLAIVVVGLVASAVPARRAVRVDPTLALRE